MKTFKCFVTTMIIFLLTTSGYCSDTVSANSETTKVALENTPKNFDQLFHLFEKNADMISPSQQRELIANMYLSAKPPIDISSLCKIWESKRAAITNFVVDFTESTTLSNSSDKQSDHTKVEYNFIYSKKDLIQVRRYGKRIDDDSERGIVSLNKDVATTVSFPANDYVNASITNVDPAQYLVSFWNSNHPMICSSLISDELFSSQNIYERDIIKALSDPTRFHVMESTVDINGIKCIEVGNMASSFHLSIEHNYAIVRYTLYNLIFRSDVHGEQLITGRNMIYQCTMADFDNLGNGIWFPKRYEIDSQTEQFPTSTVLVSVESIQVNETIPDEVFTNVIPDGAYVADGIRDMVYRWGDHPSIGSLIKNAVKSKRQTIFRNLSLVLGLCFIACWGIVEWRKRRLLKGEVE